MRTSEFRVRPGAAVDAVAASVFGAAAGGGVLKEDVWLVVVGLFAGVTVLPGIVVKRVDVPLVPVPVGGGSPFNGGVIESGGVAGAPDVEGVRALRRSAGCLRFVELKPELPAPEPGGLPRRGASSISGSLEMVGMVERRSCLRPGRRVVGVRGRSSAASSNAGRKVIGRVAGCASACAVASAARATPAGSTQTEATKRRTATSSQSRAGARLMVNGCKTRMVNVALNSRPRPTCAPRLGGARR
jgi:hypothetical protein